MRLRFGSIPASIWCRGFLKHLRSASGPLVCDARVLEGDIKRQTQRLFDDRVSSLPDKQGRVILAMCAVVLAAYRQLKDEVGDAHAVYEIVRTAFQRTYAAPMQWYFRLWLFLFRDPVARMRNRSMVKPIERMYGASMTFAEETTADSVDMLITRCAYHQFFAENGEPSLTLMFCAWDRTWMDVVYGSSRPIRTERPSTISTGGDCCRFRFVSDHDKAAATQVDVVLDELEAQASRAVE